MNRIVLLLVCLLLVNPLQAERPRLLVLTDIGGDPDDQQSLVRLLLFANEFELEGLIASASGTPGELKEPVTKPHLIRESVEAYAKVFSSLTNHAAGYPTPGHLLSVIRAGNPQRGRGAVGDGNDTDGSRFIVELADRKDERPLNISIWGGQTDLAQACWAVRQERGPEGLQKFVRQLRIHDIADQDGLFAWMHQEFQFPFYILNQAQPGYDKREAVFRGMYLGGDESLTSREWVELNVRTGHGPLGALYPPRTWTAPNPHSTLKEGDTPSWFYFLPHGVNEPNFPNWGGWGGRFQSASNGVWIGAPDQVDGITDGRSTVSRWRPSFQAHFQARLDWCVTNFNNANHAPIAAVNGDHSRAIHRLPVKPGTVVRLDPSQSIDPDGHALTHRWWHYPEAGTWRSTVTFKTNKTGLLEWTVPRDAAGTTIHLILETTDSGMPALTDLRRVILEVARQAE